MKIISDGNHYDIYPNNINMYEKLPAGYYDVKFAERGGFYLEKHPNFEIGEEKIYGSVENKVEKVFRGFSATNRNLGVILSGDKGIGKSLTARLICIKAVELGYPVILVNKDYPDIANFIGNMDQEVVVLFDEFDKVFVDINTNIYSNKQIASTDKQSSLLGLFDGIYAGKKLFIITCNDIHHLSSFILNRTGRFHYHFRFEYPGDDDIRLYMKDRLDPRYYSEIENVVQFSKRMELSYDVLRSIAFELNLGYSFYDMIDDLNLINMDEIEYNVFVHLKNGTVIDSCKMKVDLFGANEYREIYDYYGNKHAFTYNITFIPSNATFDHRDLVYKIMNKDLSVTLREYDTNDPEVMKLVNDFNVEYISFKRIKSRSLHII